MQGMLGVPARNLAWDSPQIPFWGIAGVHFSGSSGHAARLPSEIEPRAASQVTLPSSASIEAAPFLAFAAFVLQDGCQEDKKRLGSQDSRGRPALRHSGA